MGSFDAYPYFKPSDVIKALDTIGRIDLLFAGNRNLEQFRGALREFWKRFEDIRPHHQLFDFTRDNGIDMSLCLPVMQHGDEGRSKKHMPVAVLQWQPCMGVGVAKQEYSRVHAADLAKAGFPLNFLGHSFTTRFLCAAVLGDTLKEPTALDDALRLFCADLKYLQDEGVALSSGHRLRLFTLANKGDWAWLASSANLTRSYRNVTKKASAKKEPKPICHICLAGSPEYAFEDVPPDFEHRGRVRFVHGLALAFDQSAKCLALFSKYCTWRFHPET